MYQKERTYLKWKYLYYNGQTEVSDVTFDKLEDELKSLGSLLPFVLGSPNMEILKKYDLIDELSVGERGIRFQHQYPMLSLKKYQASMDNDIEVFPIDISNFFNKVPNTVVNCTPKFDGNSMELIYLNGVLTQSITRGNELGGLDRTEHMKLIVPNKLGNLIHDRITIRGEVIISTELWEKKYSDPNKVDNPRNWLAGVIGKEEIDINIMKDIDFVAYHITINNGSDTIKPKNQLEILSSLGFQKIFNMDTVSVDDFFANIYPKFKDYRTTSKYALDGIVLSFSSEYWDTLGANNHHPHYACAVKFPPNRVITYLENVLWKLGKDGEYTPVALFKPVELDGTIVKHASLYNLGWIIENEVYPGCKVEIAKQGEIIPAVKRVIEKSPNDTEYVKYVTDFLKNHS